MFSTRPDGSASTTTLDPPVLRAPGNTEAMSLEGRLSALFEELREPLYHYILMLIWDPADSEELAQEAFLRLHRASIEGVGIDNVKAWLFRVAHNLAVDRSRTAKPNESLTDEGVRARAEVIPSPKQSPEGAALDRERLDALSKALGTLSPRQRECLHLRAEGFAYREIAAILGIARPTVVENVRRAMTRLEKEFHVST